MYRYIGDYKVKVSALMGEVIRYIVGGDVGNDRIDFVTESGDLYAMLHDQDCSEEVRIVDVVGDLQSLIGTPILQAEESTSEGFVDPQSPVQPTNDSWTWTFYKLATIKGYVTIRWLGESNGYYSESVSLYFVPAGDTLPDGIRGM